MKYIHNFNSFFQVNESQTKKLKKYFTFSVVLEWYRKNKEMIAKTLGCEVSDLADEDTLMEQSYGVVNYVINPQTSGNDGRDSIDIAGFSEFKTLEKNLIHDILHNMYQVQSKEFNKSLERLQYSESEIFEEIEVLGIEESFMKNMNIPYPKTDFINQNINMLASYLMLTILKYDPNRIQKILDEEIEPYLEIYGKQYPVEGTPYENFFKLFTNTAADSSFEISNSDDFKEYMIKLINVARGIGETGGDRAQYPGNDYFGRKSWYDLSDDDKKWEIKHHFERERWKKRYILVTEDDDNISKLDNKKFAYTILGEETSHEVNDPNQLKLFPEYEKEREGKKKNPEVSFAKDGLKNSDVLTSIPIKRDFIDEDGDINIKAWFSYLEQLYGIELYELDDEKYLGIELDEETNRYSIMNNEDFEDNNKEYFDDNSDTPVDTDTKFIDFGKYRKMSFAEIAEDVLSDTDSISIMRRNFRTNDVIKNNTKIGNLYSYYWKQEEVSTKNPKDSYMDFKKSDFAGEKSISKAILTDNGKRLIYLLNNLRGYFIKNIDRIKSTHKRKEAKFGEKDIAQYRNINLKSLQALLDVVTKIDFNIDKLELKFELGYGWTSRSYNNLRLELSKEALAIKDFYQNFQAIKDFKDKVKSKEDVEFLMNYVNEKGLLKTPKDFTKFKTFVTKIRKFEVNMDKHPYKDLILQLSKKNVYTVQDNMIEKMKQHHENPKMVEKIVRVILKQELPQLHIKELKITKVDSNDVNFIVTI